MTSEGIRIGQLPWWRLAFLSMGGKKRNKSLLTKLSAFNLALTGRAALLADLSLTEESMNLLSTLASLPEAWYPCVKDIEIDASTGASRRYEVERLAELGLVFLAWPAGKIRLSDAGRFLLSLSASQAPIRAKNSGIALIS